MPEQFVVPQFIDAEDKILGPITVRQFVILLIAGLFITLFYRLFDFMLFLLTGLPTLILSGLLAFMKVNGVPVHFFLLNLIQTMRRPALRIWDKTPDDNTLRDRMNQVAEALPPVRVRKALLSHSRMQDLTLMVNTGGVYNPDDEIYG